ncbi:MAG: FAD-dependent oxidoreductase, partial [Thermoplasmata archaeon]
MEYDYDLAVIGAGCAGLAAGVYGGRAGMKVCIFDKGKAGGQLLITHKIENYIGFSDISGPDLAIKMLDHAKEYSDVREFVEVEELVDKGDHILLRTTEGEVTAASILLSTGADHKHLEVPGEKELAGKGVSYCATCDGFFFRNRNVIMVGGGSTAAIEALYLKGIDVDVGIVHRRDRLRAETALIADLEEAQIPIDFNKRVIEIHGEKRVESVTLECTDTGEHTEMKTDGVFIAIGLLPNDTLAKQLDLEMDEDGLVKVDAAFRTSNPRIFAAGDLIGGVRQAITAAAEGTIASLN